MSTQPTQLFDLLPALYRLRDAQIAQTSNLLTPPETAQLQALQSVTAPLNAAQRQLLNQLTAKAARGPLQSLLMLIEEQMAVIAADLDQFYDNQFIETCAPWVIPYIGALIGYESVNGVAPAVASPRAEVANTISFRRRKGTVPVMEQLARDVTGWGAHAVEFFCRLADTQYMNHIRLGNYYTPNLRCQSVRTYMNSGFDETAHTVDVRRIAVERGRYNIPNIGIFLWSLNSYGLTMATAAPAAGIANGFRFNPLGLDAPLFNNPVSQGSNIAALATPLNVPGPIPRTVLCGDITQATPAYYGQGLSLALYVNSQYIAASRIRVCDLSDSGGSWANLNKVGGQYEAAIDPELGRIVIVPPGLNPTVQATFCYGFNADMGGGQYSRVATFTASPTQPVVRVPQDLATIQAALNALAGDGVVEITDSGSYPTPAGLQVNVSANGHIELRGADGFRPTILLGAEISVTGGADSALDINGLVIGYQPKSGSPLPEALLHVTNAAGNQISHVGVTHCTLEPGWFGAASAAPALIAEPSGVQVVVQRSILGGLRINGQASANLTDSIVDATDPTGVACVATIDSGTGRPSASGALTLTGCTVIGKVYVSLLTLASDCLFWSALSAADQTGSPPLWSAPLWAARRQQGCVRFSYLPPAAITPRQFECVTQAPNVPQPLFYSLRYGDPAYCKYAPWTDDSIRRGADDGGEMGAFHFVLAPLRETDLRVRMSEYLPVGLEFGIFYES